MPHAAEAEPWSVAQDVTTLRAHMSEWRDKFLGNGGFSGFAGEDGAFEALTGLVRDAVVRDGSLGEREADRLRHRALAGAYRAKYQEILDEPDRLRRYAMSCLLESEAAFEVADRAAEIAEDIWNERRLVRGQPREAVYERAGKVALETTLLGIREELKGAAALLGTRGIERIVARRAEPDVSAQQLLETTVMVLRRHDLGRLVRLYDSAIAEATGRPAKRGSGKDAATTPAAEVNIPLEWAEMSPRVFSARMLEAMREVIERAAEADAPRRRIAEYRRVHRKVAQSGTPFGRTSRNLFETMLLDGKLASADDVALVRVLQILTKRHAFARFAGLDEAS